MGEVSHNLAERLRFGPTRTLNVRAGLLTGADAAARVDSWLRSKQVELDGDVLIITGRGKGSLGGTAIVKEATRKVLSRLRRAGVIESFGEDTPGSFVCRLAPLRAMLEAPARRKTTRTPSAQRHQVVEGLRPYARERLHRLAILTLDSLGLSSPSGQMVESEMTRQFSALVRTWPGGRDLERWLESAISRAIQEHEDATT